MIKAVFDRWAQYPKDVKFGRCLIHPLCPFKMVNALPTYGFTKKTHKLKNLLITCTGIWILD